MTDNVFIPGGNAEPSVLLNKSSPADCIEECKEWSKYCYIIVYYKEEQKCEWYDESPNKHYQSLIIDANKLVLSRICTLGKQMLSKETKTEHRYVCFLHTNA